MSEPKPQVPIKQVGQLERAKRTLGPLCATLPSATLRDKARKAYLICKEIQDHIAQEFRSE
jgi:hypothetical protein